jgi:hypothetical protein
VRSPQQNIGQRGAELGNPACDRVVAVMDAHPIRSQQRDRVDARGTR